MTIKKIFAAAFAVFAIPCICLAGARIEINLPAHELSLYENGVKTHAYPVAIGKYSTPTPMGEFSIIDMGENPVWTDPETMESVESGEWNPLGYRWMGFYGRYGIHGNNNPSSIGSSVSNGCVRMYEEDVEELYDIVDVGTPVDIVYRRLLVEKDGNNQVAFYVFPDVYDEQDVGVGDIKTELKNYGVDAFVSDDEIASAIEESSGEAVYVAGIVPLFFDLNDSGKKVVSYEGSYYFPVGEISSFLNRRIVWDGKTLTTELGSATGFERSGQLYSINWQDIEKLFGVKVRVDKTTGAYYILDKMKDYVPPTAVAIAQQAKPTDGNVSDKPTENATQAANKDMGKDANGKPVANDAAVDIEAGKVNDKPSANRVKAESVDIEVEVWTPKERNKKPVQSAESVAAEAARPRKK